MNRDIIVAHRKPANWHLNISLEAFQEHNCISRCCTRGTQSDSVGYRVLQLKFENQLDI